MKKRKIYEDQDRLWMARMLDEELCNDDVEQLEEIMANSPYYRIVLQRMKELFDCMEENSRTDSLNAFVLLCRRIASGANYLKVPINYSPNSFSKN